MKLLACSARLPARDIGHQRQKDEELHDATVAWPCQTVPVCDAMPTLGTHPHDVVHCTAVPQASQAQHSKTTDSHALPHTGTDLQA